MSTEEQLNELQGRLDKAVIVFREQKETIESLEHENSEYVEVVKELTAKAEIIADSYAQLKEEHKQLLDELAKLQCINEELNEELSKVKQSQITAEPTAVDTNSSSTHYNIMHPASSSNLPGMHKFLSI